MALWLFFFLVSFWPYVEIRSFIPGRTPVRLPSCLDRRSHRRFFLWCTLPCYRLPPQTSIRPDFNFSITTPQSQTLCVTLWGLFVQPQFLCHLNEQCLWWPLSPLPVEDHKRLIFPRLIRPESIFPVQAGCAFFSPRKLPGASFFWFGVIFSPPVNLWILNVLVRFCVSLWHLNYFFYFSSPLSRAHQTFFSGYIFPPDYYIRLSFSFFFFLFEPVFVSVPRHFIWTVPRFFLASTSSLQ